MTLEDWNTVLQFASAILLGLTFAVGAGAIFTGYIIGKRQEQRIEELRRQNLQLQRSIVHRMIPQTGEGEKRNWDSLKPFKGVNVLFRYSPQGEPEGFAGNLAAFPMNAGWNLLGINAAARDEIPDGVLVEAYFGHNGETDLSTEVAKSLVVFLESNGIEGARLSPGKKGTLAPNTVVVRIGQLPNPSKALD